MYFYIYKINEDENEQAHLLEVYRYACLRVGSGKSVYGIRTQKYFS